MTKITSTAELTRYALKVFRRAGYHAWRQNNGAVFDETAQCYRRNPGTLKGVSDIIGFSKATGRFLAVEIKVGRDRLSTEQEAFLIAVREAGGLALVVKHGRDLEPYLIA